MKAANIRSRILLLVLLVTATSCVASTEKRTSPRMLVCTAQGIFEARFWIEGDGKIEKVGDLPEDSDCPLWSPDGKNAILYRFQDHGRFVEDGLSYLKLEENSVTDIYQFKPRDVEWSVQWLRGKADLLLTSGNDAASHICNNNTRSLNGVECWASKNDVFTSTLDTVRSESEFWRLTDSPSPKCEMVWAPNGFGIAYVSGKGCIAANTQTDIVVLNLNSKDSLTIPGILDDGSVVSGHAPRWSPDGKNLLIDAVLLTAQGEPKAQRIMATSVENQELRPIGPESAVGGYWSHDGKSIVWWTQNNLVGVTDALTGDSRTWDVLEEYSGAIHGFPAWSPDDRFVAWATRGREENRGMTLVLDLQSGQIATVSNLLAESLAWSPDSKYLSFTVHMPNEISSCESSLDIYIVDYNGAGLRKVNESTKLEARKCSTARSLMNRDVNEIKWVP
jgi:Tol biopolymer transport system component